MTDIMAEVLRNIDAEAELQNALNRGDRVWVIGDVHGHSDALENLITELDPNPGDRIVLMGDLIDRGPDSRMVIRIAKERADTFVIRGNHEDWALNGYRTKWSQNLGSKSRLADGRWKAMSRQLFEFR